MSRYILLIFIGFLFLRAGAQEDKPLRVEIESKVYSQRYHIVPASKFGLVLFYKSYEKEHGNRRWYFSKYDVNFEEQWTLHQILGKNQVFYKYDLNDNYLTVCFKNDIQSKERFTILQFNLLTDSLIVFKSDFSKQASITNFEVNNHLAYLTGYEYNKPLKALFTPKNYSAWGLVVDLNKKKIKNLEFDYKRSSKVIGLDLDTINRSMHLVVRANKSLKKTFINTFQYDINGKQLNAISLANDEDKEIISAKSIPLSQNQNLVIGTFSNSPESTKKIFSGYAQGLYVSSFKDGQQSYLKFHEFSNFRNLKLSISPALAKKIKRKQDKGRSISLGYSLLIHDKIIENDDEFIVVAEAYYPEYHTEWRYDMYGRTYMIEVFDGFRYTHAIVAGFDKEGNLLWDNIFRILNIVTYDLKERINVLEDGTDLVLAYSEDGNIFSKTIYKGEVIEERDVTKIETDYRSDQVRENINSDLKYWYNNYLITWGYQKIRGKSKKREVFYFNKLAFE